MKRRMWRKEGGVKIESELVSGEMVGGEGDGWGGCVFLAELVRNNEKQKEKRRVFVDVGALVFIWSIGHFFSCSSFVEKLEKEGVKVRKYCKCTVIVMKVWLIGSAMLC